MAEVRLGAGSSTAQAQYEQLDYELARMGFDELVDVLRGEKPQVNTLSRNFLNREGVDEDHIKEIASAASVFGTQLHLEEDIKSFYGFLEEGSLEGITTEDRYGQHIVIKGDKIDKPIQFTVSRQAQGAAFIDHTERADHAFGLAHLTQELVSEVLQQEDPEAHDPFFEPLKYLLTVALFAELYARIPQHQTEHKAIVTREEIGFPTRDELAIRLIAMSAESLDSLGMFIKILKSGLAAAPQDFQTA